MAAGSKDRRANHRAPLHGLFALLSLIAFSPASLARPAPAPQAPPQDVPEEIFEKVDPYTKGSKELIERAGYSSLGPFRWAEGIETLDVEQTLGSTRVLWVETAHFKLGSTLGTYDCPFDEREPGKLKEELGRLSKKLPRVRREVTKIDPWLRLHLYAQRLEDAYADFESRFGISDKDFPARPDTVTAGTMGRGPYLGEEMKFTVLLTAKDSPLARFARRWIGGEESGYYRARLPGVSWFFGASAQSVKNIGADLDSALHATVVYGVVVNLFDGFRGSDYSRPSWFKHGLALVSARKIEDRWSIHVPRVDTGTEKDSGRWEPRLFGLVSNKVVSKWDEMLLWNDNTKLDSPQHMAAWSRVAWLMGLEKVDLHALLMALTEPVDAQEPVERAAIVKEQQVKALSAIFGKSPAELDDAWRKFVLRKYQKH